MQPAVARLCPGLLTSMLCSGGMRTHHCIDEADGDVEPDSIVEIDKDCQASLVGEDALGEELQQDTGQSAQQPG